MEFCGLRNVQSLCNMAHERDRCSPADQPRRRATDMDFAEAENAAQNARPRTSRTSLRSGKWGSATGWVTEWENRIATQFKALKKIAQTRGCFLTCRHACQGPLRGAKLPFIPPHAASGNLPSPAIPVLGPLDTIPRRATCGGCARAILSPVTM